MYFSGVNPVKAFVKNPTFTRYYFVNSLIRYFYIKVRGKKLRLNNYAGKKVLNIQYANELLKQKILNNEPYLCSRFGTNEINIVTDVLLKRFGIIDKLRMSRNLDCCSHSGIFPSTPALLEQFTDIMLESMSELDIFGTFRMTQEDYYIKYHLPKSVVLTHLYMNDFWRYEKPFTSALKGKKVLVVNPFTKSIQNQYSRREKLFPNKNILPEFELKTLKAVQSIAGEKCEFSDWIEALNYMYDEAIKIDFDVAILGCGAYGFPLGAMLKKHGKTVLHLGGVTQMLFGIKGKRWDDDAEASKLYNEYWIRPGEDETPCNNKAVEGGCYW